ncbi:hypothetical protein K402DRAFT_421580 [Aulographum hederae CBS 113979]|uniref:DUF7580 domain-containing protein n=1 Tax=Aulographum hederae CBS 113979 TaxID=1176131 RepID=A0A6G1GYG3_9PEZI|nr:hypothetical protein K402DRAFT_421580 [Aulographum hederae CBS 113979]
MSGVEVAGLVLAVLPLFISALEDYNDGLEPIKAFYNWKRELPHFIRKLRNEHAQYEETMILLIASVTSEDELMEMTDDTSSDLWSDPIIEKKLKVRLAGSYKAYMHTIQEIEGIMKKIAGKLDIESGSGDPLRRLDLEQLLKSAPSHPSYATEIKKRIKFGISKKYIKRLLEQLRDCNIELERFTEKSERLETYRRASKKTFSHKLQKIQGYAKTLHNVLTWNCSCRASHRADLLLEQRINCAKHASGQRTGTGDGMICFSVSFLSTCSQWERREAEVQVLELEQDNGNTVVVAQRIRPAKVGFALPEPKKIEGSPDAKAEALRDVVDLCSTMKTFEPTTPYIGFALDPAGKLKGTVPAKLRRSSSQRCDPISLSDLLGAPNGKQNRTSLTRKQRYILAVTVASSIMQLHSTPWLSEQFGKKDIIFHHTDVDTNAIDIEHPYISPISRTTDAKPESEYGPPPAYTTYSNKNTVLLALGIMLLELYFGHTNEALEKADGATDPLMMWATAHQWASTEKENLPAAFLDAITHCLRCFGDPSGSLEDAQFLQIAVEQIVLPLQEEFGRFVGYVR